MKLPLSWLKDFVNLDASADEIARRLSFAGLVVENIERLAPGFAGVFAAKVLHVEKHPNADRLNLCEVDAGEKGKFKVVCGAPNVKAGMVAPLALVGARLGKEPPLEAATIRGVQSEGMLCSERELGLSQDHAGILALSADAPIGADVSNYLHLDDTILDVEITPNRGDCLSILGLAREVSALFGVKLRAPKLRATHSPASPDAAQISVTIDAIDLCPRYAALAMSNIKLGPSPAWLRRRLELSGMRALNNVVDATNYVMLELGQPLHAFDWTKIADGRIVVRRAGATRAFTTLDNVARTLESDDLLIADSEKPLAIAGVMGGLNSEVGEATETILLESAYFEPMTIARTARRLGLRSEASYRFERGIDRAGQVAALIRVAELIRRIAGGRESSIIADFEPRKAEPREIILDLNAMEALLGVATPAATAKSRLKSLGAQVTTRSKSTLAVIPPSFRSDLNEQADLVEEVARLSGLEDIPAAMPARIAKLANVNPEREFIKGTREVMLGCGLTEATTLAFTAPVENQRFPGAQSSAAPVKVTNPLSAELSELRLSLAAGLVTALRFNLNREANSFHAFEIGKTFAMEGDLPLEQNRLAAISYGTYALAAIGEHGVKAGFFSMKGVLETYLDAIGIASRVAFRPVADGEAPFLHPGRGAIVMLDGEAVGLIGELHPAEAMRLDLNDPCALFELDLAQLISYGFWPRKTIEAPPRFPAIRRDLALVLDRNFPADVIVRTIRECGSSLLESVEVFDVYEGTAVAAGRKSIALACRYRAKDRTLTDEEVNRVHALLVEQAQARLGAELRQ
ncbi:MAG: phenylalanine--tRNA ligase subunit beta [Candidatus Binatus sp.]|uniref:phenylalanine--tRNA ligase subunit beta n=1 Tax=Candidatus Binatus sp. TaxID=2811406 RepID=UPI002715FA0B|nr:phenylalanine--tRNA ligase subunit beta [Candidatus Binatus sp.]MDO8432980.1 phenylalanine--tRNA ligase subunit beta [Candidatus Binatus sp.]